MIPQPIPEMPLDGTELTGEAGLGPEPGEEPTYRPPRRLKRGQYQIIKKRKDTGKRFSEKRFDPFAKKAYALYAGQQWKGADLLTDDDRVTVNHILSTIQIQMASLAAQDPEWLAKPHREDLGWAGQIAKAAITYYWPRIKAQNACRAALLDSKITGRGIVQVGWKYETATYTCWDRREGEGGITTYLPGAIEKPTHDEPCVRRLNPMNVWLSPESEDGDIQSAPWVLVREFVPLDDARANPNWKNKDGLKATACVDSNYSGCNFHVDDAGFIETPGDATSGEKDCLRVEVFHYYCRRDRLHVTFSDGPDGPHCVEDFPDWARGYPLASISGIERNDTAYQISQVLQIWPMQQEKNKIRSHFHTRLSKQGGKVLARESAISEEGKRALENGKDLAIIPVRGTGALADSVAFIQPQALSPDIYEFDQKAQADLNEIAGTTDYYRGQMPTKRASATEVSALNAQTGVRGQDDQRKWDNFLSEVGQMLLAVCQQYANQTVNLPIYDKEMGAERWVGWTKEDIQGEFLVTVRAGSTIAKNNQQERQECLMALNTLMPLAQAGLVNLRPVLEKFVATFDLGDVMDIIPPPPPPMPPGAPPAPGGPAPAPPGQGGPPAPPQAPPQGGGPDPREQLIQMMMARGGQG